MSRTRDRLAINPHWRPPPRPLRTGGTVMGIDKLVEECARLARDGLDEDGTFDVRSPDECSLDDCEQAEWDATVRAARAVIRRTLEFAAGEIYPTHRRACACTRCDCGNSGDAQSVADWDARQDCSNHLRSLSPKAEG